MMCDFNAIIGSHKNCILPPNKTLINEFLSLTGQNDHMHLDTMVVITLGPMRGNAVLTLLLGLIDSFVIRIG